MGSPKDRLPYRQEFVRELRDYYVESGESQGLPDAVTFADRIVEREDFTIECRRKMPLAILERYACLDGAKALDAGCGTGRTTVLLAERGSSVVGVDSDTEAVKIARSRCHEHDVHAQIIAADALALPFPAASFDLVVSQNVLEHIPGRDHPRALLELMRVLREEGLLFVQAPNRLSPIDVHSSRLPFLHWLPRKLSGTVRHFGIQPPEEDPPSYEDILRFARGTSDIAVLNRCDVWEDAEDYRDNWVNYSNSLPSAAELYFRLLPIAYGISRLFRAELNKWLPMLNLFIRKV